MAKDDNELLSGLESGLGYVLASLAVAGILAAAAGLYVFSGSTGSFDASSVFN